MFPRARLYSSRLIKSGYKPPRWLMRRLRRRFPHAHLDWHPGMKRWTLWERNGPHLTFLKAITTEDGGYAVPNMENTIRWLAEHTVRGRINNPYDLDRWLADLDAEGRDELELRAAERYSELIREGSERLYDALIGRKVFGPGGASR